MQIVQVLVVTEATAMADRLCRRIAGDPCLHLLERCSSGGRALKRAAALQPDVIALDMRLSDEDCMELIGKLRQVCGATVVVMSNTTGIALDALDAGAADFIHIPAGRTGSDHDRFASDAVTRIKTASIGTRSGILEARTQPAQPVSLIVLSCAKGGPVPGAYLLKRLPADGPAVVLLRRYDGTLSADYVNLLRSLSFRDVQTGTGDVELTPGAVILLEPDSTASTRFVQGRLMLSVDEGTESVDAESAADSLFVAAARILGPGAGGILLSGGRGMQGLRLLAQAGGLAIIENKNALLREEGYQPPDGLLELPLQDMMAEVTKRLPG